MRIMKLLTALALIVGLSSTTYAQLNLLHYYTGAEGSITTDVVGGEDGTLYGVSVGTTDAVVTDGGTGTWPAADTAPPQGMMLPEAVAQNMSSNAWSISTWVTVDANSVWRTDFAFSDGTTDNFILGAPEAGRIGNANYVTLNPPGAEWPEESLTGNDVDIGGPTATPGEIYNKVITYDGSNATLYINGELAGGSGGAPDTVEISGIDMALIPRAAVGAGSPWGDNAIEGRTHAFAIFGSALATNEVSDLYKLGEVAPVGSLQMLGNIPFFFDNETPGKGMTVYENGIVISADILENEATFYDASMYLNGFDNEIVSTPNTMGTTTTVSSAAQTLIPGETNTVYLVAEGLGGELMTNIWSFSMGPKYEVTVSPANNEISGVASYEPTVSAQIVDVVDSASYVDLYVNGEPVSAGTSNDGTTSVDYVVGPLAEGTTVTCSIVAHSSLGNADYTYEWDFSMVDSTSNVTVWTYDEGVNPDVASVNITQFDSATTPEGNVEYVSGENDTGWDHHVWTYVAQNQPAQGQTFMTPSGTTGFEVTSVWVKNVSYLDPNDAGDAAGAGAAEGAELVVRIVDPAMSNTVDFVKSEQTLSINNASLTAASGQWIELVLDTPVVLNSDTLYGFDVGSLGPYFNLDGVAADVYAGGNAYQSGANGAGDDTMVHSTGDRTFIVNLRESGEALLVDSLSPRGTGISNPPELSINIAELNGFIDEFETTLLLNGEPVDYQELNEVSPSLYTLVAPLDPLTPETVYTAGYYVVSADPYVVYTNEWEFTMAKGLEFVSGAPDGAVVTEATTTLTATIAQAADYFDSATIYLDGNALETEWDLTDGTATVTAVTYPMGEGEYDVKVVAIPQLDPSPLTNEWDWSFIVKLPTTDTSWNINFAGRVGETQRFVQDGAIAVASPSENNEWNNIVGIESGSGGDGANLTTNVFDESTGSPIYDTAGGNPIGFITTGYHYWGQELTGGSPGIVQDLFKGWMGANADMDVDCSITGLDYTASYDLYLYSTWAWGERQFPYEITEGFVADGVTTATGGPGSWNEVFDAEDADDYSACVEGENYVLFRNVTPTIDGVITYHAGDHNTDAAISGLQIREHAGTGALPGARFISASPNGVTNSTEQTLIVTIEDYLGVVDSNSVALFFDGFEIVPDSIDKVGVTTTVECVVTDLAAGLHTAGIQGIPDDVTHEWTFVTPYEVSYPTELLHHWAFDEGQGTTVADSVGDAHGTLVGTNHTWNAEQGSLTLGGVGSSQDWDDGETDSTSGSYVDLPNGIISALGDQVTIEATYVVKENHTWQRFFDFGNSSEGEGNSSGASETIFFAVPAGGGGPRVAVDPGGNEIFNVESTDAPVVGETNHVVWVYDAQSYYSKLYLNGELVDTAWLPEVLDLSELDDVNNWIGRAQYGDPMFDGEIYDMRIYDGIMTPEETMDRYVAMGGTRPILEGPAITLSTPVAGELVLSWPMSAGEYTVLTNDNLTDPTGWGILDTTLGNDGENYSVTNLIGDEPSLFIKLESTD